MDRDRSLALLRNPYLQLRDERGSAVTTPFTVRLLGRRTHVVGGRDGAQLFYDPARFERVGAVPAPLRNTLFGRGAVHGLDDAEHAERKTLFLRLLTTEAAEDIARRAEDRWQRLLTGAADPVDVFAAAVAVHAGAISDWAGVPAGCRYRRLAEDLATTVAGFGSVGGRHVQARLARLRLNRWATRLVRQTRTAPAADASPLQVIAAQPELPPDVAAVELLNILRPTVAVAWFVAFATLELAAAGDDAESFAHEVRPRYPFVPLLAARVRTSFTWRGLTFRAGQRVVLDVYGTLHDPQLWPDPDRFDPDRFRGREPDPYTLIPQGGGPPDGHRCPGERVAIELIKTAALALRDWQPVEPAHTVPLDRAPTLPAPRLLVTKRHG